MNPLSETSALSNSCWLINSWAIANCPLVRDTVANSREKMDASVANSTCYEGRGDRATDGFDGVVRARKWNGYSYM